jgi:hydrogenase nickel incorporation protein HypA/HybF
MWQDASDDGLARMHELSIANAIVEACVARASDNRILCVRTEIGQFAAVLPDSLHFCFELCARGTLAEGAILEITETPGRAICGACHETIMLSSPRARCACGGWLRIITGGELRVNEMDIA